MPLYDANFHSPRSNVIQMIHGPCHRFVDQLETNSVNIFQNPFSTISYQPIWLATNGLEVGSDTKIRDLDNVPPCTETVRFVFLLRNSGNLLARSQFWSASGSKNNTNKESDLLSAPKCRQKVNRRDILPNWILTA